MLRIFRNSVVYAWQRKKIWPWAVFQLTALVFASALLKTETGMPVFGLLGVVSLGIFSASSVYVWTDVKVFLEKPLTSQKLKSLAGATVKVFELSLFGAFAVLVLKIISPQWVAFVILAGFINATFVVAMLGSVLFSLSLGRSLAFTLDFWRRKFTFVTVCAFITVFCHGLAFYFTHAFGLKALNMPGFSVSYHSATIWVLLGVLAVFTAFFTSFLNAFLVIYFLDVTKAKKDEELIKKASIQIVEA